MDLCKILILILLGGIPRSEIAGSYGNLIFREFYGSSIMFSTALAPFYISTNSAEDCSFSIPSLTLTFLLIIAILEVISLCSFDFHFPDN